jgi:hypothetical protein
MATPQIKPEQINIIISCLLQCFLSSSTSSLSNLILDLTTSKVINSSVAMKNGPSVIFKL